MNQPWKQLGLGFLAVEVTEQFSSCLAIEFVSYCGSLSRVPSTKNLLLTVYSGNLLTGSGLDPRKSGLNILSDSQSTTPRWHTILVASSFLLVKGGHDIWVVPKSHTQML